MISIPLMIGESASAPLDEFEALVMPVAAMRTIIEMIVAVPVVIADLKLESVLVVLVRLVLCHPIVLKLGMTGMMKLTAVRHASGTPRRPIVPVIIALAALRLMRQSALGDLVLPLSLLLDAAGAALNVQQTTQQIT
jgi:hypothetical protein